MDQTQDRKTAFDLKNLILRCFDESEKAGDIQVGKTSGKRRIVNPEAVANHISMTIIGELFELEIVRKVGPMFRQFRSLERDFFYLDDRQAADTAMLGLRIATPQPKPVENPEK